MRYTVRSDDNQTLTLAENNTDYSVLQNLFLLLSTRKGTVPMYRDFGLSQSFLDKPQPVAETLAATEIREAIAEYEPRANLVDLRFENDASGRTIIILEVDV